MDWVTNNTNTIHKIRAGSHLYGTATSKSDIDIRGVCLAPVEAVLGLRNFEQYQVNNEEKDICIYELRKFCRLALQANPNILDILFAPPSTWLTETMAWQNIYSNRHLFLSQRVRNTFSGYARSQLKRIQGHRKWLVDPPDHQPTQDEFDATYSSDKSQWVWTTQQRQAEYKAALKHWNQYQKWLKERNPKRAELERKYLRDTKHSAHLVRLLLQAQNILSEGDYTPVLRGADLLAVRSEMNGTLSYDQLMGWVERQDALVQSMPSNLSKKPDVQAVEQLVIDIYQRHLT